MYVTQNDMLHSIYGSNRVWYVTHCSSRWLALDSVIAKYTLSVLPRPLDILVSGFNGDSNNCINISEIFSIPKDFFIITVLYFFIQTKHLILILVQLKYLFHLLTINVYFSLFFIMTKFFLPLNQSKSLRPGSVS